MSFHRLAVPLLAALLTACAAWRWSGSPPDAGRPATAVLRNLENEERLHPAPVRDVGDDDAAALRLSTAARAGVPPPAPTLAPDERVRTALFYSDVGPDEVDVSAYPSQQRYNYEIFVRSCSRCHTLARAINAPLVGRGWWEFYVAGMRLRGRRDGRPLSKDEVKAVLDFLEYDSRIRKVEHAREFEKLSDDLMVRFDASIDERLRALQKSAPSHLLPPP